jgi:hypothetical protein
MRRFAVYIPNSTVGDVGGCVLLADSVSGVARVAVAGAVRAARWQQGLLTEGRERVPVSDRFVHAVRCGIAFLQNKIDSQRKKAGENTV